MSRMRRLTEFWHHRDLFRTWTQREFQVRYKQAVLGAAWAIVQPLAFTIVYSVIFTQIIPVSSPDVPYPVFVYTAMLPWTYLSGALTFGVSSVVSNLSLVTKIYFPREILPLAAVAVSFFDMLLGFVVYVGLLAVFAVPMHVVVLWVPVLILFQTLLVVGLVLGASALNVFRRDIRFVVPLFLQLWLYASPVIYSMDLPMPNWLRWVLVLNPMTGYIESFRAVLLYGRSPDPALLLPAVIVSLAISLVGLSTFVKLEPYFADVI